MKHELKNALINMNLQADVDTSTTVHGNINSLVQVINNIISNSIQAYQSQGKTNEAISINKICNIVNLNFIINITSPININGSIINTAVYTLDSTIVNGFTGRLFKILIDFPSNEIIELVIEVIKLVNINNPSTTNGVYSNTISPSCNVGMVSVCPLSVISLVFPTLSSIFTFIL